MGRVKLTVQYFEGCPHVEDAFKLVKTYLREHPTTIIEYVKVENPEQAKKVKFRGSPTILINDEDLMSMAAPAEPRLACRFYPEGFPSFENFEFIVKEKTKK